jgi:hypothetical protein
MARLRVPPGFCPKHEEEKYTMTVEGLREIWEKNIPEYPLTTAQATLWLLQHNELIVCRGINAAVAKYARDFYNKLKLADYIRIAEPAMSKP